MDTSADKNHNVLNKQAVQSMILVFISRQEITVGILGITLKNGNRGGTEVTRTVKTEQLEIISQASSIH